MDKPLTVWYCDVCGERIESVDEGYVIWRSVSDPREFKIIHQNKCDDKSFAASMALKDFLGERGFAMLTAMLSIGVVKKNLGQSSRIAPSNLDEFVDLIRRVQTPYYEEARRLFGDPDFLEWNSDNNELAPYLPEHLKETIKRFGAKK